jgi:hypothetical protein
VTGRAFSWYASPGLAPSLIRVPRSTSESQIEIHSPPRGAEPGPVPGFFHALCQINQIAKQIKKITF